MLRILKFLPLLMMLKDITDAWQKSTGDPNKPAWASKTFLGAVLALVGAAVGIGFGVVIPPEVLDLMAGNGEALIGSGIALYGSIMTLKGVYDKDKREKAAQ